MNKPILVLPGDEIEIKKKGDVEVIIGPGLRKNTENSIVAMRAGLLRQKENNFFWIDSYQKRYIPAKNDYVLAIVVNRSAETIKVDIGGSEYASLSCLAFENASKRNKPILEISDLLYCRVLTGSKDMEPELVCIDAGGKANGLGLLKDGFLFKTSIDMCRRLLSSSNDFLKQLSKIVPPFEIAVGLNGRIWLKTEKCKQTLFIVEAIRNYAKIKEADTQSYINQLATDASVYNE